MPLTVADNSHPSPGTRIVHGIGAFFYLITSLPLLALFAIEAGWAKLTGADDESP